MYIAVQEENEATFGGGRRSAGWRRPLIFGVCDSPIAHLSPLVERHATGEYTRAKALPEESPFGRSARAFLPRVAVSVIQLFQTLLIAPHIQIIKAPLPDTDAALAFNQLHDGAMARG